MHTASDVAKWFLAHNRSVMDDGDSEYISNLKIQKLLYYAQGTFLAINDRPLFKDDIVAWKHGPVVESVYREYAYNGSNGIVFDEDFDFNSFAKEENELLTQVYDVFGQYSAWKLRNMTHEETPWIETQQSCVIAKDAITDYFKRVYVE
ncbi:type II toxin-antitoxin system antitoxin SocA domain-containing protein [Oscillibacter sp.]|uniref:Panacea domain-containing protein n=1 Tax=Oscillibacter sp. TaxID=1945593 RepID=UPI00289D8AF7|nr:type II toxin-antitoxin system antitoxin SocA domain-containing protein [Oscillibacter sp.]